MLAILNIGEVFKVVEYAIVLVSVLMVYVLFRSAKKSCRHKAMDEMLYGSTRCGEGYSAGSITFSVCLLRGKRPAL